MRYKTPRKPARQVVLFCFVILLLLGGMGIILISIQEENRAYSDGQAEADSLLEELRFPSGQEAQEAAEEQTAIVTIDDPPNTPKPVKQESILSSDQEAVPSTEQEVIPSASTGKDHQNG